MYIEKVIDKIWQKMRFFGFFVKLYFFRSESTSSVKNLIPLYFSVDVYTEKMLTYNIITGSLRFCHIVGYNKHKKQQYCLYVEVPFSPQIFYIFISLRFL